MVILTNKKIEVSIPILEKNDMLILRHGKLNVGVPVNPNNPDKGLKWMEWDEMESKDYDKIEEYFLLKQN